MTIRVDASSVRPRSLGPWATAVGAVGLWWIVCTVNRPPWEGLLFDVTGLDAESKVGTAVELFFYDTTKILLLLGGIIFVSAGEATR